MTGILRLHPGDHRFGPRVRVRSCLVVDEARSFKKERPRDWLFRGELRLNVTDKNVTDKNSCPRRGLILGFAWSICQVCCSRLIRFRSSADRELAFPERAVLLPTPNVPVFCIRSGAAGAEPPLAAQSFHAVCQCRQKSYRYSGSSTNCRSRDWVSWANKRGRSQYCSVRRLRVGDQATARI